uniref:Apolipoprotein L n=1 Tax=Hucho hucho TaxID=62062 RepID=A0A4W5PFD2_9TELE
VRLEMRELLGQYISDTLSYVYTVKEFCDRHPRWILQRKEEQSKMKNIKEMSDRIDLKFSRVLNAEDKTRALGEFTKDYLTQMTANRRLKDLEKELEAVLKDTLNGLEELDCFMDAVERLVVTSVFAFADENQLCPLPQGREPASVRAVITSARMACPLLIHFKRDASAFFSPCLLNVEVLHVYLENYMNISEQLCERMGLGKTFCREKNDNLMIDTSTEVNKKSMQTMFNHLRHLSDIRMDQHLRLTFLFQESALHFIGLFSQRHSRMLDFLKELERRAGKLDKMKKGGYISSVAGSAVGATGGALTIAGLCLAPVTAGLSLGLTIAGIGMGVTSGVNSLTTGVTKVAFKSYQNKKANTIFQCFMEDMQRLHGSLEKVASNICPLEPKVVALVVGKNIGKGGASLGKKINGIVKNTSAIEALMGKGVVMGAGKVGLQEGKTFAADLPDIGMLAQGTPLALSRTLRQCAVASNALFIGLDIITICKDSVSLAKGSKSKRSQLIRARAALWRTEIGSCQRIHDSLCRGIWRFRKSQRILEKPFYLVKEFEILEPLVEMGIMEKPAKEMETLGQPEDDIETLVQPMEETRLLGQSMEETRLLGQSMEETRLLGQPMEETRLLGQPMEETRLLGQPMEETRLLGQPVEETRLLGQPMEETRLLGQPVEETRLLGQPVEETRLLGQPVEEIEKGTKVVKLICPKTCHILYTADVE